MSNFYCTNNQDYGDKCENQCKFCNEYNEKTEKEFVISQAEKVFLTIGVITFLLIVAYILK